MTRLSPAELAAWLADAGREQPLLVDVREPWEFDHCHIDGSLLLPLGELARRAGELPLERDLVLICHHGIRSLHGARFLAQSGHHRVHDLIGGLEAWSREVDPAMPRY